jgi:hypothetical protein
LIENEKVLTPNKIFADKSNDQVEGELDVILRYHPVPCQSQALAGVGRVEIWLGEGVARVRGTVGSGRSDAVEYHEDYFSQSVQEAKSRLTKDPANRR